MKKLTFKAHIYIGLSFLVAVIVACLFYLFQLFEQIAVSDQVVERIKITIYIATFLVFAVVWWLWVYITKTFDFHKNAASIIRKSNADFAKLSAEKEAHNWTLNGLTLLDEQTRGGLNQQEIAANAIRTICQYLNAKVGMAYLKSPSNEDLFTHAGSYAVEAAQLRPFVEKSSGLTGEAIVSQKQLVLSDIPENFLTVVSSLGQAKPEHVVIQPLVYENETIGVLEVGFFRKIDHTMLHFIERAAVNLAITTKVAINHATLSLLYEETQQQAEELEAQQEELRTTNDELVHKTHQLEASEEELRVQQEELKHANIELEEKAKLLEERNFSIELARQSIAMKANELEQSGKYKSEFLANMSHELRTPLNSILILAKLLEDNKAGNLLPDQIKYASVIHSAGTDLLHLINNILDLSKIESGNMELVVEDTPLSPITQDLLELFNGIAESKAIEFRVTVDENLPTSIATDEQRLRQILKNLLSNAFKFTKEHGKVELQISQAADDALAFSVKDNGIGISKEKQQIIFDAFKQADGSTSRKFGGTGLGLSICLELTTILGGELYVDSQEGAGSTFTLILPIQFKGKTTTESTTSTVEQPPTPVPAQEVKRIDQPLSVPPRQTSKTKRLLIVEDDRNFVEILETYAHERGFDTLTAYEGDTGLQLAVENMPDAIILDIMLPVMDGWTVLKNLKSNPQTKNIPVHLMSADRPNKQKIAEAAIGFLKKPVDKQSLDDVFEHLHKIIDTPLKKVLVVEDQQVQSDSLKFRLSENGVDVQQAFTGKEAVHFLESGEPFDCIILDLNLPDTSGIALLDEIKTIPSHHETPVIINTAMELSAEATSRILHHTKTLVLKSDKSDNRILDEVNLFINRIKNESSPTRSNRLDNSLLSSSPPLDNVLEGKRILLVDDDMRNIFALSTIFESHKMQVETANNGIEALAALKQHPNTDLILMDIMMPEMDGYEAMEKIRTQNKFAKLPIIALTAKAMQGDRQLALDAGASDYITKPVDVNKLLSLIRVWVS